MTHESDLWRGSDQIPLLEEESTVSLSLLSKYLSFCPPLLLPFPLPLSFSCLSAIPLLLLFDKRKQRGQTEGRRPIPWISSRLHSGSESREGPLARHSLIPDQTLCLKPPCWEYTIRTCTLLPCRNHLLNLVYKNAETSGLNAPHPTDDCRKIRKDIHIYIYIFLSRAWDLWIAHLPLLITHPSPQFPCVIYFPGCLGGRNRSWTLETHRSQPLVVL